MNGSIGPITVLKLGSSVLRRDEDLPAAAREVARHVERGSRVVAVVSAIGRTTDALLSRARGLGSSPAPAPLAALLATGEAASGALLTLALHAAGVRALLIDPLAAGLSTQGPVLDARPVSFDGARVAGLLHEFPVVVLPGFYGRAESGGISLLGRGGSDLTALFAAWRLRARCRLLKDAGGVYEADPSDPSAARYETLSFADARRLNARVVQAKALDFAESHGLAFDVSAPGEDRGTLVGPVPTRLERRAEAAEIVS